MKALVDLKGLQDAIIYEQYSIAFSGGELLFVWSVN